MQTRSARVFAVAVALTLAAVAPAAAPPAGIDTNKVAKLLRRLDHDQFRKRLQADDALRAMGKPVLPHLRQEQARTTSHEVRHRLTVMIHDLTIDERVGQLVLLLDDKNEQRRAGADYALRQAGAGVVPLLKKEIRPELGPEHRQRLEKIIDELSPAQR